MNHRRDGDRRGGRLLAAALVVALAAIVVGAIGVVHTLTDAAGDPHPTATDMRGRAVTLDRDAVPVPAATSHAVDDVGGRLVIPTVGLDVALGELDEVGGQITPPGFATAYRVRNRGVAPQDADDGTVYVVMHALRGGAIGPGNYVTDIETGTSTLAPGDDIRVDGVDYAVTGWRTVDKTALADDTAIWDGEHKDRLVLITCLERPGGGPSIENMVITARRP